MNLTLMRLLAEVGDQVAGLLGGPFPGWMQSDSEDADAPGSVLYHGQYMGLGAVGPAGRDEAARQDRLGLGAQELRPGRPGSARRAVDSLYRFRTRCRLRELQFGRLCELRQDRGSCLSVCCT
jgi:hypothetical protein